jgi:CRISPR-associated protein Csd2
MAVVNRRHDILIFFDVLNGNPNGNPDAGNLPRIEPNSNRGLVSDVCLKRKVRNFITQFAPKANGDGGNQFGILIQQGKVLNTEIKAGIDKSGETLDKRATDQQKAEAAMKWLCRQFYDVRTFGGVLSTGEDVLKGSAYGQVRGPVQFTFGQSVDPINTHEITITRCAVTKEEDAKKERTMGNKHIVPYALYCAKAFVSPVFAERTGFDDTDLAQFFDALRHLFSNDQSAARAEMNVRAVYDFEHVGTQGASNPSQNGREAKLGCEHAHKLFAGVRFQFERNGAVSFPTCFEDYRPQDDWRGKEAELLKRGVKLNRIVDPGEVSHDAAVPDVVAAGQ